MAEYPLDMLIKEIEYNPRLREYMLAKKAQAKTKKLGDNVQFPTPGGFVVNPDYEAYKRRVDRHNREARKGNEDYKRRYDEAVRDSIAYAGWNQLHAKEIAAGKRKEMLDDFLRQDKEELIRAEMVRRANEVRADLDDTPFNDDWYDSWVAQDYPVNKDMRDELNRVKGVFSFKTNKFEHGNPVDFYKPTNPYKPSYPSEVLNYGKDVSVGNMVPSPQGYIYRYHTTKASNIPYIFESGLDPRKGGKGYASVLRNFGKDELKDVYTITRSPDTKASWTYYPDPGEATIRLKIPKNSYRRMNRTEYNPELDVDFRHESRMYDGQDPYDFMGSVDKQLTTVQHGGRTDMFHGRVSPKYIDAIYDGTDWQDPWNFIDYYDRNYGYDDAEWNEALENYRDAGGNLDEIKMKALMKNMGREY